MVHRYRVVAVILFIVMSISLIAPISYKAGASLDGKFVDPRILGKDGTVQVIVVIDYETWKIAKMADDVEEAIELLVKYAESSQQPVIEYIEALGGEVINRFWIINALLVEIDASKINDIVVNPYVKAVILNAPDIKLVEPVREDTVEPEALIVNWGVNAVNATAAWNLGYSGSGVRVAVVDTGVFKDHVTLQGKLFTVDPSDPTYPGGWISITSDGFYECTAPYDDHGHGTAVSSVILGGPPDTYKIGVAPNATLMSIKVLNATGYGTAAQLLKGFEWAANPTTCQGSPTGVRPHIVSASLGISGYTGALLMNAIKTLLEFNIIVVAAIGNDGPGVTSYPGNIWGVYGIGAVDSTLTAASFSSGGIVSWSDPPVDWPFKPPYPPSYIKPDFTGPGVAIPVANNTVPTGFDVYSGTSLSTPHISGIVALVLEAMGAVGHESPVSGRVLADVVYDILVNASIDLGVQGVDDRYGYGLPDAWKAVTIAQELVGPQLLTVTVIPPIASVGDPVEVIAEAVDFTVPNGTLFTVYLQDIPIDVVPWNGILYTVFVVPEMPRGIYTVSVQSDDGRFVGESSLEIQPSLIVAPEIEAGANTTIYLYGHDPLATYNVLLDGTPIGMVETNTSGTASVTITIPENTPPGQHVIETEDALTGEILARTQVTVVNVIQAPTVLQQLLLDVSGPLSVEVGSTVEVYMTAYTPLGPINITLNASLITPYGLGTVQVQKIGKSLYKFVFNTTTEGYYTLHIQASTILGNTTLYAEKVYTIQATARITDALEEIQAGVTEIQDASNIILDRLDQALEEINATRSLLEEVATIISLQYEAIKTMEASLYTLNNNITTAVYKAASGTVANLTRIIGETSNTTNSKLETLDAKLTSTLRQLESLDKQVNGIATSLTRTEARLAAVEQGVNQTQARLTLLEAMLGEVKSMVDGLGESIARLQTGLDTMREETAASIQALQERIATVSETLASQSRMLEELRNEVADLKDTIVEAITGITGTLEELTTGLQDTNKTVNTLEDEVANARSEASQAKQAGIAALGLSLVALGIGALRLLKS